MNEVLAEVQRELEAREPIFHRPEFGTTRSDFDRMMTEDFWEVGASGACYSRAFVLDSLEERHRTAVVEDLHPSGFECRELGPAVYLVTYLLAQHGRLTRRCTIWKRINRAWKIAYHQGTVVQHLTTPC